MKKTILIALLLLGLSGVPLAQEPESGEAPRLEVEAQRLPEATLLRDVNANRRFAAATMEVILTLLNEQRYEEVLPEFERILALDLRGKLESMMAQSAWIIAERLVENRQFELAHEIIDATLPKASDSDNRFMLLLFKGKIYKDEGRPDLAIPVFNEARKLKPEE